ncbi:hypothetical protein MBLNU459_g1917t4 [Dothideomycetes sp. NU459]
MKPVPCVPSQSSRHRQLLRLDPTNPSGSSSPRRSLGMLRPACARQSHACGAGVRNGRECTYPVPVTGGRRREGSLSGQFPKPEGLADVEQTRKPRQHRKSFAIPPGQLIPIAAESLRAPQDVLDAELLTPSVWQELFDIFQLHFSTDLPFIHPPTFLKPLRQAGTLGVQFRSPGNESSSAVRPPASDGFLLAFLAVTARFHPRIVAHHSPSASDKNPLAASEFYASAATARLMHQKTLTGAEAGATCDLETIQAMLMLTLHEWGMNRGLEAWTHLRNAITSAQAMGLHIEQDLDDRPNARCFAATTVEKDSGSESDRISPGIVTSNDAFIRQEIRRRTFWTCFILDRYLSNGKFRPQALIVKDMRIQLPASEQAFLFGEKVRTLMLEEQETDASSETRAQSRRRSSLTANAINESANRQPFPSNGANGSNGSDEAGKWEVGADEGLVSRYIKVLDIYGKVLRWVCGGRRRRNSANATSEWHVLRKSLDEFRESLPRQHTLTAQNTSAHINLRTSTSYTLVHTAFSLCQLLLHREMLPFIPFRHGKPQGPADGTWTSLVESCAPSEFWETSAKTCFGAARDIIDLARTCQEWGVAVETPIIGFSIYNVALLGVYAVNFPWMDVNGFLRRTNGARREDSVVHGAESGRKAIEMLAATRPRLQMGEGWFQTVKRTYRLYSQLRQTWVDSAARLPGSVFHDQSIATAQLHPPDAESTRVLLERTLRELDSRPDADADAEMTDVQQGAVDGTAGTNQRAETDLGSPFKGDQLPPIAVPGNATDPQQAQAHAQQEERWNAINSVAAAASAIVKQQSTPTQSSNGHYRNFFSSQTTSSASPSANYPQHGFRSYAESSPSQAQTCPSWTTSNGGREALPGIHAYAVANEGSTSDAGGDTGGQLKGRTSDKEVKDAETWLGSVEKHFGGDDVAAFVDGVEMGEYAAKTSGMGRGGWMSSVWGYA